MNILGIDPGTGRTGWGVIRKLKSHLPAGGSNLKAEEDLQYVSHVCVITSQEDTMPKRLLVLHSSINKIVEELKPDCMIIEQIFFGRNSKTAIAVGQARGVVMLAAASHDIPVFEYTGISVKYHLTGNGRSDKKDVQKIVRRTLGKNKRKLSFNAKDKGFDDAADALAIAIHHAKKREE